MSSSVSSSFSSSFGRNRDDSPGARSLPRRHSQLPSPTPTTPPSDKTHEEVEISPAKTRPPPQPLPAPVLLVLRFLLRRLRGDESEAEIYEFDLSPHEYTLLWSLLGLKEEGPGQAGDVSPRAALPLDPSAAQAEGIPSSAEELREVGRWVLDNLRYDFFTHVDERGATSTRLRIRMPTVLHDKTAYGIGQLLRDHIKPALEAEVDVCSLKCEFSDQFARMVSQERRAEQEEESRKVSDATVLTDVAQAGLQLPASTRSSAPAGTASILAADSHLERIQEQARYDEVQPDVCVFIGNDPDIVPSVIVEVGFSHPLPFDRARSYIYGSDGRCRLVIILDIDYHNKEQRLQLYDGMSEQQKLQKQIPPYRIILNAFRCHVEDGGVYAAEHDLRDVDVREAARGGRVLTLQRDDLLSSDVESRASSDGDGTDEEDDARGVGTETAAAQVCIPYEEIVSVVDKAAWEQAIREQPSLQQRKRKRMVPRMPTASPESQAAGGFGEEQTIAATPHNRRKKQRQR